MRVSLTDRPSSAPTGLRNLGRDAFPSCAIALGKAKPPAVAYRGLLGLDNTLEIALSAEQEVETVLILHLVHGGRLGDRREGRSDNRP